MRIQLYLSTTQIRNCTVLASRSKFTSLTRYVMSWGTLYKAT